MEKEKYELFVDSSYIIKKLQYNSVVKIKILELTEKTIYFENVDNNIKERLLISQFYNNYEIIEYCGLSLKDLGYLSNILPPFKLISQTYLELCSCNPKNGGSGFCGCTLGAKFTIS